MDRDGDLLLSTAPKWHHPSPNKMQWRDHWLQSVYFLPQKFECFVGNSVTIKVSSIQINFFKDILSHAFVSPPTFSNCFRYGKNVFRSCFAYEVKLPEAIM